MRIVKQGTVGLLTIFCCLISNFLKAQSISNDALLKLKTGYNKGRNNEISFEQFAKINAHLYSNKTTSFYNGCRPTNHTPCGNGDFENGLDTSQWQGAYGIWYSGDPDPATLDEGFISGSLFNSSSHQTIVDSANGLDPITRIKLCAPNKGRKSLRLGNSVNGAGTELISKTVTVSASNPIFSFWYAVVFEDPRHPIDDQPSFSVRVYDCTNGGTELPNVCNLGNGSNKVISDIFNPFFSVKNNIAYRDWSCAQINLSQYVGRKVTIVFTNKDCGQTGHYGYTYLDNFGLNQTCNSCKGNPGGFIDGDINALSGYFCDNSQVCCSYSLPRTSNKKGAINIGLFLYQNGVLKDSLFSGFQTIDSTTYCFNINPGSRNLDTTIAGFDYVVKATFTLDTFKLAPQEVGFVPDGQKPGQNNDFKIKCISATISGTNSVCQNDIAPRILFKATDGVSPYYFTYNINNGFSNTIATAVGKDTVSIPVSTATSGTFIYNLVNVNDIDNESLPQTGSATVIVKSLPDSNVNLSRSTTFCLGDSIILTAASGNTYVWSTGATTQRIVVRTTGNYFVTVNNSNGCTAKSKTIAVTVNPLPTTPTISTNGPTTFCQGNSVTLTSSANTGNLWSNGANTQSIVVTTAGSYFVTATNSFGCSKKSATINVTVNTAPPTPTISANGSTTFCQGGSVTLSSSAASGIVWSNGATSQNIVVSSSGSYTVTVTNSNGCFRTSVPTIVTVNPLPAKPTISTNGPTTFCSNSSVTLTSSAPSGNLWSNGATTQSINVTTGGTFSVTVTNNNGCSNSSVPITTTTIPTQTFYRDADGDGYGNPSISLLACTLPTGYINNNTDCNDNNATVNPGVAEICGNGIDDNCNGLIDEGGSGSNTISSVTATQNPICTFAKTTLTANGVNAGAIVTWYTGAGGTGTNLGTGITLQGVGPGTYYARVTGGCGIAVEKMLKVNTAISTVAATITKTDNICFGASSGSITVSASGGTPPYQYRLGTAGIFSSNNVFSSLRAGSYRIYVKDTNGCALTSSAIIVTQPTAISGTVTKTNILCNGTKGTITVNATGGTPPYRYSLNDSTVYQSSNVFTNLATGTYKVNILDSNNCKGTITSIVIAEPKITVSTTNVVCYGGSTGSVTINVANGAPPFTYKKGTAGIYQTSNVFTALKAGTYTFYIKDSNNCIKSVSATITQRAIVSIRLAKTNATCIGGKDGTITATGIGGTAPYQFKFGTGGTYSPVNVFTRLSAGTYRIYVKDTNNCGNISTTIAVGQDSVQCFALSGKAASFSIKERPSNLEASIFPNPSYSRFSLVVQSPLPQPVEINVTDAMGRIIYRTKGMPQQTFRFGEKFANGIYIVEIRQGKEVKNLKINRLK